MTEQVVVIPISSRSGPYRRYHKYDTDERCQHAPKKQNQRVWDREKAEAWNLKPCKRCYNNMKDPDEPAGHLESIQEHVEETEGIDIFEDGYLQGQR